MAQSLGNSYGQPIHFIGHSLGTLVNAAAANYLHENTGGTFSPQNTHITLLDDAALANIEGTFVQLGYTLTGVYAPYEVGSIFNCGWLSSVPRATVRWMDNYISLVGGYHVEAVNTFLAKAPDYADKNNPPTFLAGVHSYACQWYGKTITTPSQSQPRSSVARPRAEACRKAVHPPGETSRTTSRHVSEFPFKYRPMRPCSRLISRSMASRQTTCFLPASTAQMSLRWRRDSCPRTPR